MDPKIAQLLQFQDKDLQRIQTELALKIIPAKLETLQKKIDAENATFEAKKNELNGLEVQRKDLDNQLKEAEASITKFKTQQLEVKKNEEYEAFNQQIQTAKENVDQIEEQEIALLIKIDEEKEKFEQTEADHKKSIEQIKHDIELQTDAQNKHKQEIDDLLANCNSLSSQVDPVYLRTYENVKKRVNKGPFVSTIEAHRCTGCHLKVSNDTVSAARQPTGPVNCDNCGRLLYYESDFI